MIVLIISGIGLALLGIYGVYGNIGSLLDFSSRGISELSVILNITLWLFVHLATIATAVFAFVAINKLSLSKLLMVLAIILVISVLYSFITLFVNVSIDVILSNYLFTNILLGILKLVLLTLLLIGTARSQRK